MLRYLNKGHHIILDRYAHSGVAYSAAKGLNIDWCKNCDRGLWKPDVNIFLSIDERIAKKREEYGSEIYEKVNF